MNGPKSIGFYPTGQAFLEEYYTIAKIMRAGIRTHNVDANTRLCTATVERSLIQSFGSDGPPASMEDVDQADVIVFIGRNRNETNTVLLERTLQARQRSRSKIIEIDPRLDMSSRLADMGVRPKPGTNVALLNGIIHLLISNGWIDENYTSRHTVGYEELKSSAANYTPETVERITGVPAQTAVIPVFFPHGHMLTKLVTVILAFLPTRAHFLLTCDH